MSVPRADAPVVLPVPGFSSHGTVGTGRGLGGALGLANDTAYDVSLWARASPGGGALALELLGGVWVTTDRKSTR